MNIGTENRWN